MNKKVRKLLKTPKLYFSDLVKNKKEIYFSRTIQKNKQYTILTLLTQDLEYLDKYFHSIVNQNLCFKANINIILLDTYERIEPNEIIEKWKNRYPSNIQYKVQNNTSFFQDLNISTPYISFVSNKDFLDKKYFKNLDNFIKKNNNIKIINSLKYTYNEQKEIIENNHSLKYQFKEDKKIQSKNLNDLFIVSIKGMTISSDIYSQLKSDNLDIITWNKFLINTPNIYIGFSAASIYIERIHLDSIKFITDLHKYRYDFLMFIEENASNNIPQWIIKQTIYYVFEYIKQYLLNPKIALTLSSIEKKELIQLFRKLMDYVSVSQITNFKTSGFSFKYQVAFLDYFKNTTPKFQILYIKDYDQNKKLVQMNYFAYSQIPIEKFQLNTYDILPEFTKTRSYMFFDSIFLNERILYIPINKSDDIINAKLDNKKTQLMLAGKQYKDKINADLIIKYYLTPKKEITTLYSTVLKKLAKSSFYQKKYKDAWLLMDKDSMADDNAEHLYRYILNNHKDINAYFLLKKSSKDWNRLKKEGFRLIAFGTTEHKILLMNTINILSSHAAPFVVSYLSNAIYKNHLNFKFTFLQHGVTKDNISKWMNSRKVDCFIATSQEEYNSIAGHYNTYKMTPKEVALTGFSRHDALLNLQVKEKNMIMIMPTWRLFLAGELTKKSGDRTLNPKFYTSKFAKSWKSFFHSKKLLDLSKTLNYELVFFPHPNILPYLEWFELPSHIRTIQGGDKSIQHYFKKSKFMITDYSSVAFDMAFLNKPVLYYHFDHIEFFSGSHSYSKGYYDYVKDGFGAVAYSEDELLDNISTLLHNNCIVEKKYQKNIAKAFLFRDGKSSERIVKVVKNLHEDKHYNTNQIQQIKESINIAIENKDWSLVAKRLNTLNKEEIINQNLQSVHIKASIYTEKLKEVEVLFKIYQEDNKDIDFTNETNLFNNYSSIMMNAKAETLDILRKDSTCFHQGFSLNCIQNLFKSKQWQGLNIAFSLIDINEIDEDKLDNFYYILGRTHKALENYDEALKAYAKSLSYNTNSKNTLIEYSTVLYKLYGKKEISKEIILKPFKENKYKISTINIVLIKHLFDSKNWEPLNIAFNFISIEDIKEEELDNFYYMLARTHRELENYEKALNILFLIQDKQIINSNLYIKIIIAIWDNYIQLEEYKKSILFIDELIITSNNNIYKYLKILSLYKLGKYTEARESLINLKVDILQTQIKDSLQLDDITTLIKETI